MPEPTRRERAIAVARELADDGGWDAIAMRAVAERSGSALATLYREFPSKTHLVLAMADSELSQVRGASPAAVQRLGSVPLVAQLLETLTLAALERPRYTAAVLHAVLTGGSEVAEDVNLLRTRLAELLTSCLEQPRPQDVPRLDLLVDVWFAELLATVHDRQTPEGCTKLLASAAGLVLADHAP
ncbi:MAG: TetR/AcrR family transcriptional regulator [Mycobacteriales bacterium]